MLRDLYNSEGVLIAYEKQGEIFKRDGTNIGYTRVDDVFDNMGRYLGTIIDENRLYYFHAKNFMKGTLSPSADGSVRGIRHTFAQELPAGAEDAKITN